MQQVRQNITETILYMMPDVMAAQYRNAVEKRDSKAARFLAEIGAFIKQGMGNVVVNNVQPVVDVDVDDSAFMERMDRIMRERGVDPEKGDDD